MKKFLSLALVVAMLASSAALVACGDDSGTTTAAPNNNGATTTQAPAGDSGNNDPANTDGGSTDNGDITTTGNSDLEKPPVEGSNADETYRAYQEIDNLDAYKSSHVNFTDEGYYDNLVGTHTIAKGFEYDDDAPEDVAGSAETPDKLFDGDTYSKWCSPSTEVQFVSAIVWKMTEAVKVTGYSITTGNDSGQWTERNPCSWRLYGATTLPEARMDDDDGNGTYFDNETVPAGWTLIDAVDATDYDGDMSSLLPDLNEYEVGFEAANPGTYQYFMLLIDYCEGGTFQIGEFTLYGTAD